MFIQVNKHTESLSCYESTSYYYCLIYACIFFKSNLSEGNNFKKYCFYNPLLMALKVNSLRNFIIKPVLKSLVMVIANIK